MQILRSGSTPSGESSFIALLSEVEQGVAHLLVRSGNSAMLHKVLVTGEVVSQDLNLPLLREITGALADITATA